MSEQRMNVEEAISALDGLDAGDPERAHYDADEILLAAVPLPIRQAYERVVSRSSWWAHA